MGHNIKFNIQAPNSLEARIPGFHDDPGLSPSMLRILGLLSQYLLHCIHTHISRAW